MYEKRRQTEKRAREKEKENEDDSEPIFMLHKNIVQKNAIVDRNN